MNAERCTARVGCGPQGRRRRTGFVLPFVVLAIAAATLIGFAFTGEALQATRAIFAQGIAERADYAADAAIATALAAWSADSAPLRDALGVTSYTIHIGSLPVQVQWDRRQPLLAMVRAAPRDAAFNAGTSRRIDVATRDHLRAVRFVPPSLPIIAALATSGAVRGSEGTLVSGSDVALPGSPCGPARDTLSVPALAAASVAAELPGGWPGSPIFVAPPASYAARVTAALDVIRVRAPTVAWSVTPTALPQALPNAPEWKALVVTGDSLKVVAPARWKGLLAFEGNVTLTGAVSVTGLLLVRGQLDARAAQLDVQGAVVVADTGADGVMLGSRSRLFYDRCAVQMALATVSRPSLAPFSLWYNLPQ